MLLTLLGWLLLILAVACLVAAVTGRTWSAADGFGARPSSGARVNYILAAMFLGILGWWLIDPPEFVARYLSPTAAPGSIDAHVAGVSTSSSPDASSQPLAMAGGDMSASARTQELEARNGASVGGAYGATPAGTGSSGALASAGTSTSATARPAFPAGGLPTSPSTSIVTSGQSGTRWARGDSLLPASGGSGSGGTSGAFPPPPPPAAPAVAARDDLGVAATSMSSPPTPGWSNAPAPVRARLEGFAPGTGSGARAAYTGTGATPSAMALPAYQASGAPTLADIGTTTGAGARRGQYTSAAALPASIPAATPTPSPAPAAASASRAGARSMRPTLAAAALPATVPSGSFPATATATRAPTAVATTEPVADTGPAASPVAVARRVVRRRGWGPRPSRVAPGPLDVTLADRLGGDQVLEVLRLTIEGREVARWRIDAESPDIDMAVGLPAPGLLHYVLEGEFLRPDGRIERLRGKGCTAFTEGRRLLVHRTRSGLMSLRQG